MDDPRPLFLIGFMGAGKTAIGKELAARLGWRFVDTDTLVERAEGRPIDAIFRESGEGVFREAEWRALGSLAGERSIVVATGGGLFLGAAQRRFIRRHGRSVWLDVELEVARERVGRGDTRPLWITRDAIALRILFEKRRAAYALAEVRVDTSHESPGVAASRIVERLYGAPN